ncbi:transmembrane protein [Arabidopsis thaliana]|uniref:Dolichyl-diphosphooligosaccharide-protein glycosyltransferase subunit OST5 n=1 Tax=Arabidopsis thaliana TaxID=3702 RepID=F4JNQ9_ARATH|nr:uncharacterized protein AT4G29735 [Arabidopsis thaliana]AEE85668.1 transmembrane protein [Arabidopsis thaliana]|eukprot:NP_001154276.1 transmembrane protein [Arabidopsis thaliana]
MAAKPIASPIPVALYPTLSVFTLAIGLVITAIFFIVEHLPFKGWQVLGDMIRFVKVIYEATSSRKNRSVGKELATSAVASVFLGFGSLFLLLASGVYV